ncbi:hypothetical protein [Vibrio agarivorans]|uniref:hypothetical protein n=1 Tax=Vibrio agarivorans TaxID=153622 RepID=UPI00222FE5AD|nr:hypothetical protein [Vibrio agarivorans]
MKNDDKNSYDAIRRQKQESQQRFYEHLLVLESIANRALKSKLIKPERLPKLEVKNLPNFD